MIDAVVIFGLLNIAFEFVLLSMMTPRTRLRLLGNPAACNLVHVAFLVANLTIHWATLIGTMSAILAFISSIGTINAARYLFGRIEGGRYYTVGHIKYSLSELI